MTWFARHRIMEFAQMLNWGASSWHRSQVLGILRCAPDTRDILSWSLRHFGRQCRHWHFQLVRGHFRAAPVTPQTPGTRLTHCFYIWADAWRCLRWPGGYFGEGFDERKEGFPRGSLGCKSVSATWLPCCLFVALLAFSGCGAKGDPKPAQRFPPAACTIRAIDIRTIEVVLPKTDVQGAGIAGVEAVKIYYLSLGTKFPSPMEVFAKGEPILERRRQDLPSPGSAVRLSLSNFGRPAGWLVAVPFRAGNVPGEPSAVLAWLDPSF